MRCWVFQASFKSAGNAVRISVRANAPKKKRATKAQQAKAKPMAISRFLATSVDKSLQRASSWRL